MSAKKRNKVPDWGYCDACSTWSPVNRLSPCCTKAVFEKSPMLASLGLQNEEKEWGTVRGDVLDGFLVLYDESDKNINTLNGRRGYCNIIYLHPSTMNLLKLNAGASVTIDCGTARTLGVCWPGKNLKLDSVALSEAKLLTLGCDVGDLVSLSVNRIPVVPADTVIVSIAKCTNMNLDGVEESLCCFLDGCDILTGEIIQVTYLGSPLQLKVNEIRSSLDNPRQLDKLERTELARKSLNLSKDCTSSVDVISNDLNSLDLVGNYSSKSYKITEHAIRTEHESVYVHAYHVSYPETKVLVQRGEKETPAVGSEVSLSNVLGGYQEQVKMIMEALYISLQSPEVLRKKFPFLSMGILLHGPPGTGKTLLARTVIEDSNLHCITICGPEILSKYYGETESKLRGLFQDAFSQAPCVVFIDELDALCPKREDMNNETEKRVVSTLLTLMDSLGQKANSQPVVVIAATNRLDAIDQALRRPGRFDKEIEMGVPNTFDRGEILRVLLTNTNHGLTDLEIDSIAELAHGYVGADLAAVVREAFHGALKRVSIGASLLKIANNDITQICNDLSLKTIDFKEALNKIRPSALKSLTVDIPRVRWTDVGGQTKIKQLLKEAVEWPLRHAEAFKRLGVKPPSGVLLYGPPGCSKTLLAKALATESGLNFISVKGPELFNKFLGESEKAVRLLFLKARTAAPSIIFFDELDALGTQRNSGDGGSVGERVLAQMLTEMDGIEGLEGVIVVAATNRPDLIDSALLRPGRIDRMIYVPLPDRETRVEIFKIQFRTMPVASDVDINILVEMSENYSGAEICALCKEAAIVALRENIDASEILQCHFDDVMYLFKPRTKLEQLTFYEKFNAGI